MVSERDVLSIWAEGYEFTISHLARTLTYRGLTFESEHENNAKLQDLSSLMGR